MTVEACRSTLDTNAVTASAIPVGFEPYGIAFDSTHNRIYVTTSFKDLVYAIDTINNTVSGQPIKVGKGPVALLLTQHINRVTRQLIIITTPSMQSTPLITPFQVSQ